MSVGSSTEGRPENTLPPPPTGILTNDVLSTVTHIGSVPCARNSLMSGIASGVGIGFVRGMSSGVLVAGNWAVFTFALVSLGSWHLCQKRMEVERTMVQSFIEHSASQRKTTVKDMPKRVLNQKES